MNRYVSLMHDVRDHHEMYFDCRSPLDLHVFLGGYQYVDVRFREYASVASEILASRYQRDLSMGAGQLAYLCSMSIAEGYEAYVSAILDALDVTGAGDNSVAEPQAVTIAELLPDLRARAPMLIGSWDARDLRVFFCGLFRALDDAGHDTLTAKGCLAQLEADLRGSVGVPGRWDRILYVQDGGRGRSVERFVDMFEQLPRKSPA